VDCFNVFKVDASESICEINVSSMQKGDEIHRHPAKELLDVSSTLSDVLGHLAPGEALVIYRGTYVVEYPDYSDD
jgi:hypothetical protein